MLPQQDRVLRIVIVEDVATEAELVARELKRAGLNCSMVRVDTAEEFMAALRAVPPPELIMSDFSLPRFDGMTALKLARIHAPDTPFIFVSGTIGEERAIEALKLGATDYVLKTNLARLAPSVRRALMEAADRRAKVRAEQRLRDLVRIHSMLSNINSAVLRSLGRKELLEEAVRIAADQGGYGFACVFMVDAGKATLSPFVWRGRQPVLGEEPEFDLSVDSIGGSSITARAVRERRPVVCNDLFDETQAIHPGDRSWAQSFRSVVSLPLVVDETAVGALNLYSTQPNAVTDDELNLLRQVVGNISFALQYLHREDKVQFLAYFDPLTSLAQRSLFAERLARMLNDAQAREKRLRVAVFDLERLSAINDRYGRHVGDRLLQLIAGKLKVLVPDSDCLGHFGGGRFGVVLTDEGVGIRDLMVRLFERPYAIEGEQVHAAARSGVSVFPDDGVAAQVLVQNAELALREARRSGERHMDYNPQMNSGQVQRLTLEYKLRRALQEEQFDLHYQPKISADDGRIVGLEALMRWHDPEQGLVPPVGFIPVLEETGLIVEVGKWAIERAVRDSLMWKTQGLKVPIAVNVSNLQMRRKDFVDEVLEVLGNAGPGCIDLEITESALMADLTGAVRTLARLKEAGVGIAIDDFGTGYSSLRQLARLPVDVLKIDRSFIVSLSSDPADMTLVSTIISLARAFDLKAVAEGVETAEQLKLLRLLKCHQLQGYLICRPMPREGISKLLHESGCIMRLDRLAGVN